MADIMTVDHPQWDEFAGMLEGIDGCNFRDESAEGEEEKLRWDCGGGSDKSIAERILGDLGGFNVPRSLEYFDRHGGHCDCEILFNVANLEPGQRVKAIVQVAVTAGLEGPQCPKCDNDLPDHMDIDPVANIVRDPDDEATHDIVVLCLRQTSDADDAEVCGAEVCGYSTLAHLRRKAEERSDESAQYKRQLEAMKASIVRRTEIFGGGA